eukprot:jgi/Tetstr1/439685/TSEL_028104.t1
MAEGAQLAECLRALHFGARGVDSPEAARGLYLLLDCFLAGMAEADRAVEAHGGLLRRECQRKLTAVQLSAGRQREEDGLLAALRTQRGKRPEEALFDLPAGLEEPDWLGPSQTGAAARPAAASAAAAAADLPVRGAPRAPLPFPPAPSQPAVVPPQPGPGARDGPRQRPPDSRLAAVPHRQRQEQAPSGTGAQAGAPGWRYQQLQQPQHPSPAAAATATGSGPVRTAGRPAGLTVGCKRDAEGQPQPPGRSDGAAEARWSSGVRGRPGSRGLLGSRHASGQSGQAEGLEAEDEAEAEDEGGALCGGGGGFSSARQVLISDMRKKGQAPGSLASNQPAPRMGLSRGGRRGGGAGGYVPPFIRKGMEASAGGNGGGGGGGVGGAARRQGGGGGGGGSQEEGVLSARTLELLGAGDGGELPEELARLEPALLEQVCNEVMHSGGLVHWDDIAGQAAAKQMVQEMVVWPMLNPHIFQGARAPPKGLLLFGPPGTGKTLLGKAIASNIRATFFNISASSLTSKWIGQGEKMVRALFAVATQLQPAVIFIDEIDSLLSARKSDGEHESSRRLKTEMLVQMEGCDPASADRRVLLVGATNRPEELDEAARRRMPKQLYIPLPCEEARQQMLMRVLGEAGTVRAALSEEDMRKVVAKTAGYSGSDMRNLIQEACQGPVRDAIGQGRLDLSALCEADLRPVGLKDFAMAVRAQKRTVSDEEVMRYEAYNQAHGAKLVSQQEGEEDVLLEDDW